MQARNSWSNTGVTRIAIAALLLIVLLVSVFILRPWWSAPTFYSRQMQSLDRERNTVLLLSAASTAASAAMTGIPDDVCTPIAQELADLSLGFLIVLTVLIAEKYLMPIFGGLTASVLIPTICILGMLYLFGKNGNRMRSAIVKLVALSIALMTFIPCSIFVSDIIQATFDESIHQVFDRATSSEESLEEADEENLWQQITGAISEVMDSLGKTMALAENILGYFIESIAILLVVNCLVPILVLFAYLFLLKAMCNYPRICKDQFKTFSERGSRARFKR
ncbi:MAG: hypothetical protein IJ074_11675 [Clostridia bacterium]|nr:hypothetical protein [Clostridia bacterium]